MTITGTIGKTRKARRCLARPQMMKRTDDTWWQMAATRDIGGTQISLVIIGGRNGQPVVNQYDWKFCWDFWVIWDTCIGSFLCEWGVNGFVCFLNFNIRRRSLCEYIRHTSADYMAITSAVWRKHLSSNYKKLHRRYSLRHNFCSLCMLCNIFIARNICIGNLFIVPINKNF